MANISANLLLTAALAPLGPLESALVVDDDPEMVRLLAAMLRAIAPGCLSSSLSIVRSLIAASTSCLIFFSPALSSWLTIRRCWPRA